MYLLPSFRPLFFCTASSYYLVPFHLTLQKSLEHFFQGMSSGHKLPQLLFIWKCLNFSLNFEGPFCWGFFFCFLFSFKFCIVFWLPKFLRNWQWSYWGSLAGNSLLQSYCFQSLCDLVWAFYLTWSWLRFFDSYLHIFDQIWEVFRHFIFTHWHFWVSGFSSSKAGIDEAKRKHTELLTIRQPFCSWSPSSSASSSPFRASCVYFVYNNQGF